MSRRQFPIIVKRGNVRVKIYSTPSSGFDNYTVAYYFGGKRVRKTFADLDKARLEAETVADRICAGELNVLSLTSADRTAYLRSVELLKPSGVPLEMAVMQFAEAERILQGRSLIEAAKYYARQHRTNVPAKRVSEVVEELLAAKEAEGLSEIYVSTLGYRLTPLGAAFNVPIALVQTSELGDYIRNLRRVEGTGALSGVSKNCMRKSVRVLFRFAQLRGYLPKGRTEADELPRLKEQPAPIGIFTPVQMARLLSHASPDLIPTLAIGAFAGLRHAEILRLDWEEVDLAGGHIEIKARKAKTASRRLVPVSDNLRQWLAPYHNGSGRVVRLLKVHHLVRELSKKAEVQWPHNGLRHSFISYRVAQVQNVAQVALEAGNSPQIIFRNYRELVKPADAVKWFSIAPATPANVIPAPQLAEAVA